MGRKLRPRTIEALKVKLRNQNLILCGFKQSSVSIVFTVQRHQSCSRMESRWREGRLEA